MVGFSPPTGSLPPLFVVDPFEGSEGTGGGSGHLIPCGLPRPPFASVPEMGVHLIPVSTSVVRHSHFHQRPRFSQRLCAQSSLGPQFLSLHGGAGVAWNPQGLWRRG